MEALPSSHHTIIIITIKDFNSLSPSAQLDFQAKEKKGTDNFLSIVVVKKIQIIKRKELSS